MNRARIWVEDLLEKFNLSQSLVPNIEIDWTAAANAIKDYVIGYSETILGRKRAIHEITASAYMVRQLGERLAMNSPIQGSAADIIKLAMLKVYSELKAKHPDAKLILQVHDELIIEAPDSELDEIKELLVRNMESAMNLSVKLAAEVNTGHTWYDLK